MSASSEREYGICERGVKKMATQLTFNRWWRMTFCRWSRTYSGHLTNRVKSALGGRSPPMPNDLGLFSKRGFCAGLDVFLVPSGGQLGPTRRLQNVYSHGAEAGLDFPLAALGCKGH